MLALVLSMLACWLLNVSTAARLAGSTVTIIMLVPHMGTGSWRMMIFRVAEVGLGSGGRDLHRVGGDLGRGPDQQGAIVQIRANARSGPRYYFEKILFNFLICHILYFTSR